MSPLSPRVRAFTLVLAVLGAVGLSMAPATGHRQEQGPRPGLASDDQLLRARLVVDPRAARSVGPLHLAWPADGLRTGWFGEVRAGHLHPGVDIDGDTGDAVWAAGPGRVAWAGDAPAGYGGYGTMVDVDHGNNVHTLYAHLSRLDVATGELVEAGTLLGAMGTSGNVTGSHLHFEVRVNGTPVDPEDWLPVRIVSMVPDVPTYRPRVA
jgi:murein DD-endopeptidase MepM/ murein hydrolase activator NlpD